jgi:hypothetical protein
MCEELVLKIQEFEALFCSKEYLRLVDYNHFVYEWNNDTLNTASTEDLIDCYIKIVDREWLLDEIQLQQMRDMSRIMNKIISECIQIDDENILDTMLVSLHIDRQILKELLQMKECSIDFNKIRKIKDLYNDNE